MLLAAALLFTMDGSYLYAMDAQENVTEHAQEESTQSGDVQGEELEGNEPGESEPGEGEPGESEPGESEPGESEPGEDEVTKYKVEFDLNGGYTEENESSFSMQVEEGMAVDASAVVEVHRKGYFFQGWLDEAGTYYDFEQKVEADMVLSASWTPITYYIQFDLNGGKGETPTKLQVNYDEEVLLSHSECYKTNYVLVGWEQEGVGIYQENSTVKNLADEENATVVLKAVWRLGKYKVHFDANGGSGKMEDEAFSCGKSKKLSKNKYTRAGYVFTGWNTRKDGKGKGYQDKEKVLFENQQEGSTVVLYAMWKGNSYLVQYNGNGSKSGKVPFTRHVYGTASKLGVNHYKRAGYTFVGWNTRQDGKGKTYKSGAQVKTLTTKAGGTVTLYAKWKLAKYTIKYKTNKGKLSASAKKSYSITTNTFSLPAPTRKGYDFDGWYKDKKLKKRVSEVKKGSSGNKTYYAKWVKCTRKPSTKYAVIKTCKAAATGKIKVSATVKKRVASSDDRYYLVYVSPYSGKPYKMAKKAFKKKKLSFTLKTSENQGYATAMFGIAVKKKGKYYLVSKASFVKNPEKAAKNKSKYKLGKTKKGMQFWDSWQNTKELEACGAKNSFLNVTASQLFVDATVPYKYNGKTYYFNRMDYHRKIVSECNKKGINVTMQILLTWVDGQTDLIDSRARVWGAANFYTWNVRDNASREKMEAAFCYLGSIFGKKSCYVSNWILGNEINIPSMWNYAGYMSSQSYFNAYAHAFRALYYAVRSQYSNARVFICMDNSWNTSVAGGYTVKSSIAAFVSNLKKIQKGLKWNLAYHAYSAPLTYTNFWDGYGITYDENSPHITMKNLHVLTGYMKKTYGSSVRIILSEQGYSSSWGQANQAAAIAASYYIAACDPMVDAFIIRSYYDHPIEVAQDLSMGIAGKEAFAVYKYMDTKKTFQYTNHYLGLIGITSWNQLVPGFQSRRIYSMYRSK